ncbi:hypothetical protein [Enterocloster lavalensis]|uniref:hypothetical protein n=1 Tax=Enterocloster lavalensis TaxID=460384 RepID=UPI000B805ED3|nr:hypothetical protein [Enterocloster lavalensis]
MGWRRVGQAAGWTGGGLDRRRVGPAAGWTGGGLDRRRVGPAVGWPDCVTAWRQTVKGAQPGNFM